MKTKKQLLNTFKIVATLTLFAGISSKPVFAGSWQVAGLQVNGQHLGGEYMYAQSYLERYEDKWSNNLLVTGDNTTGGARPIPWWKHDDTAASFGITATQEIGKYKDPGVRKFPKAYCLANISVKPKFIWIPQRINKSAENNYEGIPDPDDKPLVFYYWERCFIKSDRSRAHSNGENLEHVKDFLPEQEFSSSFLNPDTIVETVNQYPEISVITRSSSETKVTRVDPGNKLVVYGDERKMSVKIYFKARTISIGTDYMHGAANCGYNMSFVNFNLKSRMKDGTDPADLDNFYDHSSIAAGPATDDFHRADVLLQMTQSGDGYISPIEDYPRGKIPNLRIGNKEANKVSVKVLDTGVKTNSEGKLLAGIVSSGDVNGPKTPYVYLDRLANSTTTDVKHEWIGLDWRMGENGEKNWNPDFGIEDTTTTEWIWAKSTPIYGPHFTYGPDITLGSPNNLKFTLTHLEVREKDVNTGQVILTKYTTDPTIKQQYPSGDSGVIPCVLGEGDHMDRYIYKRELDANTVDKYVSFGGVTREVITDALDPAKSYAIYKGQMSIKKSPNFRVDNFMPALQDEKVFEPVPENLKSLY